MNVISVRFAPPALSQDMGLLRSLTREAGAMLVCHTGLASRIRFDGRVGCASVDGNYRLGIFVGEYPTLRRRPLEEDIHAWIARRDASPKEIRVDVLADPEWLSDGGLATEGSFKHEFANPEFLSLSAAVAWIHTNCFASPVPRTTSEDHLLWEKQVVFMPDEQSSTRESAVTVREAAKHYGVLYGYSISEKLLRTNHDISREDAKLIVAAVMKILPRKKT